MKNLYLKILKFLIYTIGKWSNGISLCISEGLTSGKMLDYIYRNKAQGKFFIGKIFDRIFLSQTGWECIRNRKSNLEEMLSTAVDRVYNEKKNVLMLDVASGPALYILDVLSANKEKNIKAICRDLEERWLVEGSENAKKLGLDSVVFEKGDALDEMSFSLLPGAPDICISSGFYDWIVDDNLIKKSINIISDLLKSGGYFVFSNQTGHVDMKMVSEIFSDFNKNPLRMTVRPADLVNGWAQNSGFKILETKKDKWGYYSVTLAQKIK